MALVQKTLLPVCLLLFLITFAYSNLSIKAHRNRMGASYSLDISSIPPKVVKLLAGEFSGLSADFLLLQIGSFIGSNTTISDDQWKIIQRGYEQAFELDPYFQQTYIQAQAFLAWDAKMPEAAIDILDRFAEKRPWDWRPGYYAGFDHYYFLDDYQTASDVFLKTSQIKHAPLIIALLGSRFAAREKRAQASIQILELMLEDMELNDTDRKEINNRIQALKGVEILQAAVEKYKLVFFTFPSALDDLVTHHILERLPENPYSKEFSYHPENGDVFFDRP